MKVIVTGATGFVGAAVVKGCIADSRINEIVVLSRKAIAESLSKSAKVEVILHDDFLSYPASLIDHLGDAQGCIWCIGGKVQDFPDLETARRVSVNYTLAAAQAFAANSTKQLPETAKRKFVFVFCSGRGAEQDETKSLWLFPSTRKVKGAVEKGLVDLAKAHPSTFESYIVRPGGIIPENSRMIYNVVSYVIALVLVSDLAKVIVDICIQGSDQTILENEEIVRRSQAV